MTLWLRQFPWTIFVVSISITVMGLCGLVRADELYGRTQLVERQIIWLFFAMLAMFGVLLVPNRLLSQLSPWFFLLTLLLLAVTLFMPPINGSRRWIPLKPEPQDEVTARLRLPPATCLVPPLAPMRH